MQVVRLDKIIELTLNGIITGNFKDGPWSYRLTSFAVMMPIYSCLLVTVGTIFGRHHYFRRFAVKMWARFLPKSVVRRLSGGSL